MILNTHKPVIERSGDFAEQLFSIGDHGLVFDILRSKMYSNPILAVCREISSNAKDAMIEAGKKDIPIEITLPTPLEPTLRIKDQGPGIDPARVENVFIKFGGSTKRDTNEQTGYFGLGCKSPFSITTSFTVETIVAGIQYNYCCYIDETNIGKISLLDKFSTDKSNGTSIIIPIEDKDIKAIADGIEFVCRHWDVKPKITNDDSFIFETVDPILSGTNWVVAANKYYQQDIKLIIGGIEYPINYQELKDNDVNSFCNSTYGIIYLYFKIGDLSLSANREQVHLDKNTIATIIGRFKHISSEIKDSAQTKINACANYWEANVLSHSVLPNIFHSTKILKGLQWKGYDLIDGAAGTVYMDSKLATITAFNGQRYSSSGGTLRVNLYHNNYHYLAFGKDYKLVFNDTNISAIDIDTKHVRTLFVNEPDIRYVYVITPVEKQIDKLNKQYHLDEMALTNLSDVAILEDTATKTKTTKNTVAEVRFDLFKFDRGLFTRSSIDTLKNDAQITKVFCTLKRPLSYQSGASRHAVINTTSIDNYVLSNILTLDSDISFYGAYSDVPKAKIKEYCGKLITLDKFLNDKFLNDKLLGSNNIDFCQVKESANFDYDTEDWDSLPLNKIIDPKSAMLKFLKLKAQNKEIYTKHHSLLLIYEAINGSISFDTITKWQKKHPDQVWETLVKTIETKYPMLYLMDRWAVENNKDTIIDYINIIDSKKGKKNG